MKQSDVEIPFENERDRVYRFFEILPALLSYSVFITPFVLALFEPAWAAYYLVAYVLIWFAKAMAMSIRVIQGYTRVKRAERLDWAKVLKDLQDPAKAAKKHTDSAEPAMRMHAANMDHVARRGKLDMLPDDIVHVVIIATYNESQDIIHPTIDSVLASQAVDPKKKVAFFLAYEGRTGKQKEKESKETIKQYREQFMYAEMVRHDLQPGEITGKGGNATMAGRRVAEWAKQRKIDPSRILVTVLDSDNRPAPNYLAALEYSYIVADDRKKKSYQPIAMFTNNIWDVPAIMRLSATHNSVVHTGNAMRLHALRNFSAHSQSLDALLDSDFWSVRTIVEDGHQFWRMYFTYDGDHEVIPLYTPVYQDAVLADTYKATLIAQFKQIRRWTYGASDIAYVATRAFFIPNKVPKLDAIFKFARILEGHVTWATYSLLLVIAGWVPLLLSQQNESVVAIQLPRILGQVNTVGLFVILVSLYIGLAITPQRPPHYSKKRWVIFLIQWAFTPIFGIIFNSMAAYYSQTRLATRRYIGSFDVTPKSVKKNKA